MPKPSKPQTKPKMSQKLKAKPEAPSITTKKSYWILVTLILAVTTAVTGITANLNAVQTSFLVAAIVALFGFIGFVRVEPSTLSIMKRAAFIFMGLSLIGFGIWAATTLILTRAGFIGGIVEALGVQIFITGSLGICLSVGALIGELIGRSRKVQERLFPQKI